MKVPFPVLPSFNIAASIMSYARYEDEIHDLLYELCRNTRNYAISHRQLLRSFLVVNFAKIRQTCHGMLEEYTEFDDEEGVYITTDPLIETIEIALNPSSKGEFEKMAQVIA